MRRPRRIANQVPVAGDRAARARNPAVCHEPETGDRPAGVVGDPQRLAPGRDRDRLPEGESQRLADHSATPRGIAVTASIPHVAGVEISTPRNGVSETCRGGHGVDRCTQSDEACPMPPATWQLRLRKRSGPAGVISVRFVVGPPS